MLVFKYKECRWLSTQVIIDRLGEQVKAKIDASGVTMQTLSYEFPANVKPLVSQWAHDVSVFYTKSLTEIDEQTAQQWLTPEIFCRASSDNSKDDTLENQVVHFIVQLTILLGHESSVLRVESALFLIRLVNLLDIPIPDGKLGPVLTLFHTSPGILS